jgi:hypothetical protein
MNMDEWEKIDAYIDGEYELRKYKDGRVVRAPRAIDAYRFTGDLTPREKSSDQEASKH